MKRIIFFLALFCMKTAYGALIWVPTLSTPWGNQPNNANFLTIDSYRVFFNGYAVIITVRFKSDGWVNTGCAASDNNKMLSYWSSSYGFHQLILAPIVDAVAQNKKVRVEYDGGTCNADLGNILYGIEPEPSH